jgi:hypothetical protein
MATDENFSFAESALQHGREEPTARPDAAAPRPKRTRFTLADPKQPAIAGSGGFDPYNSTGGFDRKQAWDRVNKR